MWIYKVIHPFYDLQDDNYLYRKGDIFPRDNVIVAKKRLNELKTAKNKIGVPLIKAEQVKKD